MAIVHPQPSSNLLVFAEESIPQLAAAPSNAEHVPAVGDAADGDAPDVRTQQSTDLREVSSAPI